MVVGVPVEGRVRDHERRVAELAEGPVVGKVDAHDDGRSVQRDHGQVG